MTEAPTPAAKPTKKRRTDAYVARAVISIPLNLSDPNSYSDAIKAAEKIKDSLPEGSTVKIDGSLGKI